MKDGEEEAGRGRLSQEVRPHKEFGFFSSGILGD